MSRPLGLPGLSRWGSALAVVLAAHATILVALTMVRTDGAAGASVPAVTVDLAPLVQAPVESRADLAPGPVEQAALPSPPAPPRPPLDPATPEREPGPEAVESTHALAPPPPATIAVAVPERPETPPKPVETRRRQAPDARGKAERDKPPPRSSARQAGGAPMRQAAAHQIAAPAADLGSGASLASWQSRVAAHLNNHKQYPAAARARGESGTAVLTFTIDRTGSVLSASLGRSSGSAALDGEATALARRASPVPPPPPGVGGGHIRLVMPIRFSVR